MPKIQFLAAITIAVAMLSLSYASNSTAIGGFGEGASWCGAVPGCLNFTVPLGTSETIPWIIENRFNNSFNFYIALPEKAGTGIVPKLSMSVDCIQNTGIECIIPANSNYTINVTITMPYNAPVNTTWDFQNSFIVEYADISNLSSNSSNKVSIANTAKRIHATSLPSRITTTTSTITSTTTILQKVVNTNNVNQIQMIVGFFSFGVVLLLLMDKRTLKNKKKKKEEKK